MATPIGLPLPEGADPVAVAGGLNPALSGWLPLISRRDWRRGPQGHRSRAGRQPGRRAGLPPTRAWTGPTTGSGPC